MALPDIITVEDFFGPPEQSGAAISPDGTRIAYLAPWKNRLNVWVQNLDSDADPRCVTADETRSVLSYEWTDDPRWLLYLQDSGGDVFGSRRCDCGEQLDQSLDLLQERGEGVLLYLRQEGRGIGLTHKVLAYGLQEEGWDTVEANRALGLPEDARDYRVAAEMLRNLGIARVLLMTNNPAKIRGLPQTCAHGILHVPLLALLRGRHGKEEVAAGKPDRRPGTTGAALRLARAVGRDRNA